MKKTVGPVWACISRFPSVPYDGTVSKKNAIHFPLKH